MNSTPHSQSSKWSIPDQFVPSFWSDCPHFVSFEGIEGSGKGTQVEMLADHLRSLHKKVTVVREPGATEFGEKLREAILGRKNPLSALAEAHLFASSRAQLLEEVVLPKLKDGEYVICDRYIDSSLAYQGRARDLGSHTVLSIHSHYPLNLLPNITFYLDISIETSFQRQKSRNQTPDYFERERKPFYQKLIEGYQDCLNLFPERFIKCDGERGVEEVHRNIVGLLKNKANK